MAYSIDPKTGGDGIHRYIIGVAILEAIMDRHDEFRYATSVETACSAAQDLIAAQRAWWDQSMAEALLTEDGRQIYDKDGKVLLKNADISKESRHRQLGTLMILARRTPGVFGGRKAGFDKGALDFFKRVGGSHDAEPEDGEAVDDE